MQSLRHKPRIDFPPKLAIPEPPVARRRKPAVTPVSGPRKKPMLIRNLGGAGAAKSELNISHCIEFADGHLYSCGRHEVEP